MRGRYGVGLDAVRGPARHGHRLRLVDHREEAVALVHVGHHDLDAHGAGLVDGAYELLDLAEVGAQRGRHELYREVPLEIGGLIRDEGVRGGV